MSYYPDNYPQDRVAIEIELEAEALRNQLARHHARPKDEAQQIIMGVAHDFLSLVLGVFCFGFGFPLLLEVLKRL